jgi:hypothetical protein
MIEPLSIEQHAMKDSPKTSSFRSSLLNAYLILASLCAISGLIISSISIHKANELMDFKSSHLISDLERTFNSTAYAFAQNSTTAAMCSYQSAAEWATGQTSIPGQCVTVTESYTLWVTRLAQNCAPYAYAQENCTGAIRQVTNHNFSVPSCVAAAGEGKLDSSDGDYFKSFQILCT